MFNPWLRKIPWRREQQPTLVFLPGESHWQKSLAGYIPWRSQRVGHDWATKQEHTADWDFPGGSDGKESAYNQGDPGLITGSGISPGEGSSHSSILAWKEFHGHRNLASYSPWGLVALVVKNSPANVGDVRDTGSIPELGRSPGGGHGNPLQYPYLENPMDRGAWQAIVHGVAKSQTQLSNFTFW